jgi:hypothetical protein
MRLLCLVTSALALVSATTASAQAVSDGANDFLAGYTGAHNSDLDILSASAAFDGSNFLLSSTQAGAVGSSVGSLFVWGVDRGSGTARLAAGTPSYGVLFDSVVVLFPDGTLRVVTFPLMGAPTITNIAGGVTVAGNTLSASVPLSLLFSMGLAPTDYDFTLWSRLRVNPAADGASSEIADFVPNLGTLQAAAVPEPSTWLSLLLGFGAMGIAVRRARPRTATLKTI